MQTQELLSRVAENLSVRRAFGPAYEKDGLLVIPVALVAGGGGGGEGTMPPSGSPADRSEERPSGDIESSRDGLSTGSGGGFGGLVLPLGTYVVTGDRVRWVPAVDVTRVVLAGFALVRLLLRLRTRGSRETRALQRLHR